MLAIRETQIETTASYHFSPMGTVIIFFFGWKITSVGKDVEKLEPSYSAGGNIKYKIPLWNIAWQSLKM